MSPPKPRQAGQKLHWGHWGEGRGEGLLHRHGGERLDRVVGKVEGGQRAGGECLLAVLGPCMAAQSPRADQFLPSATATDSPASSCDVGSCDLPGPGFFRKSGFAFRLKHNLKNFSRSMYCADREAQKVKKGRQSEGGN